MDGETAKVPAKEKPSLKVTTTLARPANACGHFQKVVDEYLIRHRSVLDVISKCQEANARVNRAVSKAVTACGCVRVTAGAQEFPTDGTLTEIRAHMKTHLEGDLCEHCREVLDIEVGRALFYLTAICNLFDLRLEDVIRDETKRVTALGVYNLT